MKNARELRDERAGLKVEAQTILDAAKAEERDLTPEERERFDEISDQIDALHGDIKRAEKMAELNAESESSKRNGENPIDANIGMTRKEVQQYSIIRAINAAAEAARGNAGAWQRAGLEREASVAVAERFGREPRSFFLPNDVIVGVHEQRDLTVGTPAAGGYLVETEYPMSLIELLRNRMALAQAGVTILDGLVGDMAVPKHTAGATSYWVAESGSPTEGSETLGQVTMTPHTLGAYVDISRKLLKQSSVSMENFVRDDLARSIALGIDYAGLHGDDGSDANQPDGIAATSGIGSVAGGTNGLAPAWSHVIDLETEVAQDNADIGSMAYMTNAKVRGKLKQTFRNSTYGEIPVWENNELNGYPALVTNQVSSTLTKGSSSSVCSAIFFGVWSELVVGMWGDGVDILVDPYSLSTQGAVRVVAFDDVDFALRHVQAFAAMLDALTT